MPPNYTAGGVWLNKWLNEQKQIYNGKRKGKTLSRAQTERLESIGICWRNRKQENDLRAWQAHYEECREYFEKFGHLNIEGGYKPKSWANLTGWLVRQRAMYKSGKLLSEQIAKLENIGMVWDGADAWEIGFDHAKNYAAHNGDLLVRGGYVCEDGYRLGNWIAISA